MTTITPCLLFNGQAEAAMKFYRSIFKDTKILKTRRQNGKVTCVWFRLQGRDFMCLNGGKHKGGFTPDISFMVTVRTQREVDNLWAKLSKGGEEVACGWLRDKYGVSWQITPKILLDYVTDKNKKKADRVFNAMLEMTKIDIATLKRAYNQK